MSTAVIPKIEGGGTGFTELGRIPMPSAHSRKPVPDSIIAILKRPLPPEAVKQHPTKKYLSSIKVPFIIERLNEAFGINGWPVENEIIAIQGKMVVMKSVLRVPEYGIYVEQFGGNDNDDLGDAYKGACTDALSKIGSYLYIAMDVYKGLSDKPESRQAPKPAAKAPEKPSATPEQRASSGAILPQTDKGTSEVDVKITSAVPQKAKNGNRYLLVDFNVPYDKHGHVATCFKVDLFNAVQAAANAPHALLRFEREGKYLKIVDVLEDFSAPQPAVAATEITDELEPVNHEAQEVAERQEAYRQRIRRELDADIPF